MTEFDSLRDLVADVAVCDYLLWIGDQRLDHVGASSRPNEVTAISESSEPIRVDGRGSRGGKYHFEVYSDGTSQTYYHNPSQNSPTSNGPVVVARITDSPEPVPVKQVFDRYAPDRS